MVSKLHQFEFGVCFVLTMLIDGFVPTFWPLLYATLFSRVSMEGRLLALWGKLGSQLLVCPKIYQNYCPQEKVHC